MVEPEGGDTNHGITASGWALIIGAFFTGLTSCILSIMNTVNSYNRENVRQQDVAIVAQKVDEVVTKQKEAVAEVKTAIDVNAQEHQEKLNQATQQVIKEVKKVEK